MSFVHLHVHSCYSLLDGSIKIKDLVETAKSLDMPAVALTDHGQMYGILPFYKAAREAGVKPILGVETYVVPDRRMRRPKEERAHLILLAQNLEGYRNLCRLISRANIEGFYYKPRVDHELLAAHSEGVIALSACLSGEVPDAFLKHGEKAAAEVIERYLAIFPDRYYLEIQYNRLKEQDEVNEGLIHLAGRMGLPLVATNDCHYLKREHAEVHDVLLCIQTGKTVDEPNRLRFNSDEFFFKSPREMAADFPSVPEALANTLLVAEQCDVEFGKPVYAFPALKLDEGQSAEEKMADLARRGLERRFESFAAAGRPFAEEKKEAYRLRLEMEIELIIKMGFPGYFLIVADFINWAKDRSIPVGPGRGSAAGSLVAYALSITDVDPIRFDLLFERFLNPERVSMPDIDVDFCTDGRDAVIRYVTENYGGKERVSQIITFGQMKAKAVIRDVGRALGLTFGEVSPIAKLVPDRLNITLEDALKEEPRLGQAAKADPKVDRLLKYALLLENLPRHASTHAAGVVIGDKPLMEHLPLCCDANAEEVNGEKGQVITQFDMKGVESIGLIKFDFLGLKTLTVIDHCLDFLRQGGVKLDLQQLDFEDPLTFALLGRGDTTGIFQLESSGMREILIKLKPTCIDDLMALVALYRPGPLQGGMVDIFIDGKHGRRPVVYELPQLEPILKETYGVILYQEQVMRISQVLANYSLGEADLLRRAMGKKNAEEMAKQKARFLDGARENRVDPAKAEHIFNLMAKFAEYGFNKSHSAAYAIVAYHTAYLKAHHPVEFMAALMSSEKDNQDKVVRLIGECRAASLAVLPPDVNESDYNFSVAGGAVRFGLGAVKGLGASAIESILQARSEGPFRSLFDFCERVDTQKVNRRVIESLIKCGAFDLCGGADRAVMFLALDEALDSGARRQRDRRDGQMSMFDLLGEAGGGEEAELKWPRAEPWRENVRLAFEKEILGFFLTGHPLARLEAELAVVSTATADGAKQLPDKTEVRLGGLVAKVVEKKDKKGHPFAYVTLEDLSGSIEALVFSKTFAQTGALLRPEEIAVVSGTVEAGENGGQANVKIIVREVMSLPEALEKRTETVTFKMPLDRLDEPTLNFLKTLLETHPGAAKAHLLLQGDDGQVLYKMNRGLKPSRELIEAARGRFGAHCLEFR